jgi:hypothetical protein
VRPAPIAAAAPVSEAEPRKPRRVRAQPASRPESRPRLAVTPIALAAAPPLEAPALAVAPRQVRVVRIAREEVHVGGPGSATAHFFVVRAQAGPQPQPTPEMARAIKAARASGVHVADAGDLVQRLRIKLYAHDQGE